MKNQSGVFSFNTVKLIDIFCCKKSSSIEKFASIGSFIIFFYPGYLFNLTADKNNLILPLS